MSSGGSNYSTGTTGGGNQVSVDTPASNPASYTNAPAPAPGGKGGFPSAQSPYAQQQPQVYMPPQQPSYYQQAFPQQTAYTQSSFYAPQQQYGGNAYARPRPYSPQTPIGAPRPIDEMQYAPGGFGPGQLISQERPLNPDDFRPLVQPGPYAGPTSQTGPVTGGPGATPPREQMNYALGGLGGMPRQTVDPYQGSYQISEIPYQGGPKLTPVAATHAIRPEPNYSGGLGSLASGLGGLNPIAPPTPEQQRLSQQQYEANMAAFRAAHPNAGRG